MAEYLRYRLLNEEPIRMNNSPVRQSDQNDTMDYIQGAAIRGFVINQLAQESDFSQMKAVLFSDRIAFMNAMVRTKEHLLIPSPRGFYEDKTISGGKKLIENVVTTGKFSEGTKRAGLGRYCYLMDDCIHYYNVPIGSEIKILMNTDDGRKVFRGEYIYAGQCFEGYIRLSGEASVDCRIEEIFQKDARLVIGNARSTGFGNCRILSSERIQEIPYLKHGFAQDQEAYMMLLSDTAFRNGKGEICGIDTKDKTLSRELEEKLGISGLKVDYASTGVRFAAGYNRTWGTPVPSVPVYEAGSVFHLKYDGTIPHDKMESLCDSGIGIRRNEGFGRVLFLKDYEKIEWKLPEGDSLWEENEEKADCPIELTAEQKKTLLIAAKGYYRQQLESASQRYILENQLDCGGISNSFLGSVEARLLLNQYNPEKARQNLKDFFGYVTGKEVSLNVQKKRASSEALRAQIGNILSLPLEETLFYEKGSRGDSTYPFRKKGYVMGIPIREFFPKEEEDRYKLKLAIRMIRFERKGEKT